MAVHYNITGEHQPLVAEAPKKNSGRVVAAVAALILGTAVTAKTPSVYRAATNLATCGALDCGKATQLKLDTSQAGKWAPKHDMCISDDSASRIAESPCPHGLGRCPPRSSVWRAPPRTPGA